MADDVPVCDVLCEAMEYLSKLGSNLRNRSETLKEKKIRKDKLKNAHAVQKAANKVLLICELSKKSLDNVESGVQKILKLVDASQASIRDGGKVSTSDKSHTKYQYFNYRSKKLKVSKKVPLKHFMSAKVLAKKMPVSIQDKYPVYHDCKLYRLRKRIARKDEEKLEKPADHRSRNSSLEPTDRSDKVKDKGSKTEDKDASEDELEKSSSSINKPENDSISMKSLNDNEMEINEINPIPPVSISSGEADREEPPSISSERKEKGTDSESRLRKDSTSSCKRKDSRHSPDTESDTKKTSLKGQRRKSITKSGKDAKDSDSHSESDTEKQRKEQRKKHSKHSSPDSDSDTKSSCLKERRVSSAHKGSVASDSNNESDTENSKSKKISCKKHKKNSRKSEDSYDSDSKLSDTEKHNLKKRSPRKENRKDSSSGKSKFHSESKKEKELKTKRFKNIRVIDDSSTSSKEDLIKATENAVNEFVDLASNYNGDVNSRLSPNNGLSTEKPLDIEPSDVQKSPEAFGCEKEDKSIDFDQSHDQKSASKPVIKCVSLSKLLKPDALPIEEKTKQDKNDSKSMNECKSNFKKAKDNKPHSRPKKLKFEDEEIFWREKRLEVKAFKARNFVINVVRLPTLSTTFLIENKLKHIIQNGSIICEVRNESIDSEIQPRCKQSKESSLKLKENAIGKADDSVISKVKNDLLNDSDSDKSDSNSKNSSKSVSESIKNSLLHCSDSDKNEEHSDKNEELSNKPQNGRGNKSLEELEQKEKSNDNEPQAKSPLQVEKTPERELSPINDTEKVKSSLLKDSSEDSPKTPHDKKKNSNSTTPLSKRKHIMESMHAKKMLLTYSSSSETEDEQLNTVLKEIKDTLLKEISSGDENTVKNTVCKKILASSDSDEDVTVQKRVRKKRKLNTSTSPTPEPEGDKKSEEQDGDDTKDTSCIDQVDGTMDEESSSSTRKMGRSRGKPAASSSQNSDAQDDKDIDGLTNLNTLNKTRSRDSEKAGTSSKGKKNMPKTAPLITGEGLLEAPESSEASAEENDTAEEDLPAVKLSGLNGSGIEHLAKDDLLGESDSSATSDKNKSSEDAKEDGDSDTEDTLKAKRRKAHAISSDSDGDTSRRKKKDENVRMSDFEDSGEDSSEPKQKNKRKKKKETDSDASAGGSSDEGGKKKRRRIKQIDSDGSGSDTENEGRNKHGRKNIRKVMGKNQLEEATKKAARQEKERMARIAERQKLYNNLQFDESGKPDEVVLDKVVLDFDPETKEPLIEVDRGLVKKLKPHQANGIKFMWDACFESVKRIKKDRGSGCILAHCMGLGKTLQVVSLTHTLLTHRKLTGVRRVLVVCPLSTVLNWVNEFRMWLKHAERDYELDVYELSRYKQNSERAFQLSQWFESGGVCVLGYEMFRNLSADNPKKFKKKMLKSFQESLVDPGPDMVVCDEGHLLKNEKTSLSQSMNRVKTLRRIVLTGTPLQNNLKEYYCMVQFVKPNLLGKYNEYLNRFVNPITNGQYTDSTEHDIRVMKRRSHVLHKMLDGAVQRRDYGVLAPFLPPKHEYVLFITLSEVQIKLYQYYLDNYARRPLAGKSSGFLFPDFQSLQRIWTHPLVLKYNSERYEIMQQKKRDREEEEDSEGSLADFIDDNTSAEETSTEESSDDSSGMSDDSRKKSKKKKEKGKKKGKDSKSTRRGTRANPVELEDDVMKEPDIVEVKNDNPTEWWINLVADDGLEDIRNSHKLVLLFEILRQCEAIGDKLLVFSQSLYSLDLIEEFLRRVDEATQDGRIDEKLGGHVGSWSPGVDYFRLDGSTSCENRSIWCKNFNREDNPRARLFLISTRAGGLGINLVAANRVVIFDVSWNPSHDVQSIFRVYRFGQKKPCYIYRFLAMGTMEEKIYERQVTKQAISKRVIDEQQIDRHYAANDLAELYMFEPTPPMPRPVPPVPKDRFFAEMLKEHEALIYKFHEHDSLLENKEEETLSEEERKAAWEDFENEKNKPPPSPFPTGWPMHNGMMPNMLAQQQQQQLAYATLATMLRKEMPTVSDDQIRSMLPLIYGANPALMQKLNDMYKYTQPGMMNPASMMNMNAAGGAAGMGGGGTSGLQYEPPWQRQQQQQQQMRLQQLMQQQQQNSMGAKYYAGGLGSRDPIAMALQQQRAREIMVGDAGRPRGRPPLQPRAPSAAAGAASGDVVNLDSD